MSILVTPLTDRIICQYCSQGSVQLSFNSSDKLLHHLNTHHRHHHHTCPCNPARSLPNDLEFRDHLKTCRLALSLSSTSRSHQQQVQPFAILSDSKLQCPICELEIPVYKFREFDGHMCNPSLDKIIMGCRRYNPQNISAISISAISSLSKMSAKKHQLLSETEQRQNKSPQFGMIFLKEDNNFSCGLCLEEGKEFTAWTSEKLGEHMRTIHPRPMDLLGMVRRCEEGGWVCVKCRAAGARIGWKFENDFEVKRHLSNCHKGVRGECKCLCGMTNFTGVEEFTDHLKDCPELEQMLQRQLRGIWDGKRFCGITTTRNNGRFTTQAVVAGIVPAGVGGETLLQ